MQNEALRHNILYSCNESKKRGREQFVPDHSLSCLVSGEIEFYTNMGAIRVKAPSIGFATRNQLVKTLKMPGEHGEPCKSISIWLDQESLKRYSLENDIRAIDTYTGGHPFFRSRIGS